MINFSALNQLARRANRVAVKNVHGSSEHPTSKNGDCWLDFCKAHCKKKDCEEEWPPLCQCCLENEAVLGGHVTIVGGDNSQYILPMCASCNGKTNTVFINVDKDYLAPLSENK